MRSTDFVRGILDLLDQIEDNKINVDVNVQQLTPEPGEQNNRFRQVLAMLDADSYGKYSNEPNEIVSDISSVTDQAGGGLNGSKHPNDLRVKDPRGNA